MPNYLTAQAGLKLGPIVIETFFKHYLERKSERNEADERSTSLRREDLLWQEAFEVVKSFLNQATRHTVEELQEFSNARIPVAPWIWVERVLVPMSSCDTAATHLIKALGGEAFAKRIVGGTKWWQVRGMRGVDCQWICQKSHMQDAPKRKKEKDIDANGNGLPHPPSSPRFLRKISNNWASPRMDDVQEQPGNGEQNEGENEKGKGKEKESSQDDISDMDETRCMLYAHGGGYYFGSIDQERYCLQRYARKINGRVFAVNYRLAPQYPFPCAIQDMLAASLKTQWLTMIEGVIDLFLIDPPPDAKHAPIPPQSIVLGGDSAGGGLCLATLQVMRDSGIPLPAAAVLISPWCDLTHSFPSTVQNTSSDIIPPYGLCLHKPSVLWPPPPDEITAKVRAGLRERFKKVAKRAVHVEALVSQGKPHPAHLDDAIANVVADAAVEELSQDCEQNGLDENLAKDTRSALSNGFTSHTEPGPSLQDGGGTSAPTVDSVDPVSEHPNEDDASEPETAAGKPPIPWEPSESFHLIVDDKPVTIDSQIQLYCPNSLLMHPLISPALGYLGGLPPLLVIASDMEVLRDEIVYLAHKAANPDRFPINEDSKRLYPPLQNMEGEHRPTPVHLQVYDETAHVLPLFAFTTPAKYCYRAIALFTKHFTSPPDRAEPLFPTAPQTVTPEHENHTSATILQDAPAPDTSAQESKREESPPRRGPSALRTSSIFKRRSLLAPKTRQEPIEMPEAASDMSREDSGDIAGKRFKAGKIEPQGPGTAGDPSVYTRLKHWPVKYKMIRERVSTHGVIRPLESESEIPALKLPPDHVGMVNESAARRYLTGHGIWTKKFAKTSKKIEAQRKKNLELAKGETIRTMKTMAQFQEHLFSEHDALDANGGYHKKQQPSAFSLHKKQKDKLKEKSGDAERHSWGWAWALDGEHPPPSSIVSRRDTVEARNLARVADLSVEQEESKMSGNMLWTVLVNFLTAYPNHKKEGEEDDDDEGTGGEPEHSGEGKAIKTKGSRIFKHLKSLGRKKREPSPAKTTVP